MIRLRSALAATLAALMFALTLSAGEARAAVIPSPCGAWHARNTALTANAAIPDTAAIYWATFFQYEPGLRFLLSGQYLGARYMSFNVYDEGGASFDAPDAAGGPAIKSSLPDFRIRAGLNSTNPWSPAGGTGPNRNYAALVEEQPSSARGSLPIAPAGTVTGERGALILRAYRLGARATLPTLRYQIGSGPIVTVPTCARPSGDSEDPGGAPCGRRCPRTPRFRRLSTRLVNTQYPNADTAYVAAPLKPPSGSRVVVIRGRAPTAPTGRTPVAWPDPAFQVRYWSMCNNVLLPPFPVVVNRTRGGRSFGCKANDDTQLRNGGYTYVVGRESQRRSVTQIGRSRAGLTFLPFSNRYRRSPHLLVLRNMLPADTFAQSTAAVPAGSGPSTAARVMGRHYPRAKVCTLSALRRRGPARC